MPCLDISCCGVWRKGGSSCTSRTSNQETQERCLGNTQREAYVVGHVRILVVKNHLRSSFSEEGILHVNFDVNAKIQVTRQSRVKCEKTVEDTMNE